MTQLMIANWLVFWRETGNRESIVRELSAGLEDLRDLRGRYQVGQRFGVPLRMDEIERVMRAVAGVSLVSGVPVSELVRMADS